MKTKIKLFDIYVFLITLFKGFGAESNNKGYVLAFVIGCIAIVTKMARERYTTKELMAVLSIFLIGILDFVVGHTTTILFTAVAICGLKGVEVRHIVKISLWTRVFAFLCLTIGSECRKMSSDVFAIYQIDNSEKNREYRCRSYEYQIQHGFMITADNYGTGYSGTATRGMGAEAIRKKMESINPDKFKIRKFGVSDVIGLTAAGKTSFFYVDKDRLVRFNGFFPKPQSGTYLILDEGGYQVAGQKGTWMVSDEVEVDGQRFVQMRSEQTKNPPPSIILHESGAFVTQTALGFDGEATRKMRAFLQGPKPELLHHQKFFENGTAERAKESGTEQNYNMIDGCVNNVPKKPRRIGGRWSVLDRLHIKQAERRQKDNALQQEQERSRKN